MEQPGTQINSVKKSGDGFIVNGKNHVPNDTANSDYKAVQAWIDEGNTPAEQFTAEEIAQKAIEDSNEQAIKELEVIDKASIRAIREYIASKPDAPQILKEREAAAQAERVKFK